MRRTEIATLAKRWMAFWQGAALDDFDAVHADDFIDHGAVGRSADRTGLRSAILDLYRAFPNFIAVVELVAIEGIEGMATIIWSATGQHEAEFLGQPPTNRLVRFRGIELIRCRAGALVERWGEWDEGAILDQIARPS